MRRDVGDLTVTRRGSQVIAKSNSFRITFDLSKGAWNYIDKAGFGVIRDAYTRVALKNGRIFSTLDAGASEFITDSAGTDELGLYQPITFSHQAQNSPIRIHLQLRCYHKKSCIVLYAGVENLSETPVALEEMALIDVSPRGDGAQGGVYLGGAPSGYHAFLNTELRATHVVRKMHDGFSINLDALNELCYDGVLYDTESKRSIVFGFLGFQRWRPAVKVGYASQAQQGREENHGVNYWSLCHKYENYLCRPGETVYSEPIYLNFADRASDAYQLYAEMVSKQMEAKPLNHVFSSWRLPIDEGVVDEKQLVGQIDQLAKNQFCPLIPNGLEYIQIEKAPESLTEDRADSQDSSNAFKWLAEQIHERGLKAGLRFTPFAVDVSDKLLKVHPEYFFRDKERNKPALLTVENGREVALLDVSHPGARANIRANTRRVIDEWGYDLLKADLLPYTIGLLADASHFAWHDASLTSVQLYRHSLQLLNELIRESKKPVILAGSNSSGSLNIGAFALNEALSGYGVRMTEALWNEPHGLKQAINAYVAHLPMFSKAWTSEFGVLMIDEPLPLNEAIVAVTAAALSGGAVICGDDPSRLKSARAELLSKIFPLTGNAATPIDLYEKTCPQLWNLPLKSSDESWNVVGVFNWEDKLGEIEIPIDLLGLEKSRYYLLHDFWNREFLGVTRGWINLIDLPPRSVKLLCIRAERDAPQLLSTDIHFTQGSVEVLSSGWDRRSQSFLAVCKPPRHSKGTLFVYVPEDYLPTMTSCYGASYHFWWKKPIYEIELGPTTGLVHLSVQFAKTSG